MAETDPLVEQSPEQLLVHIPDRRSPWLEPFLDEHPELRDEFEELARYDREMRDFAAEVIRQIYAHYTIGGPSRWGLLATLRSFQDLLEEEQRERGRRQIDAWHRHRLESSDE